MLGLSDDELRLRALGRMQTPASPLQALPAMPPGPAADDDAPMVEAHPPPADDAEATDLARALAASLQQD